MKTMQPCVSHDIYGQLIEKPQIRGSVLECRSMTGQGGYIGGFGFGVGRTVCLFIFIFLFIFKVQPAYPYARSFSHIKRKRCLFVCFFFRGSGNIRKYTTWLSCFLIQTCLCSDTKFNTGLKQERMELLAYFLSESRKIKQHILAHAWATENP